MKYVYKIVKIIDNEDFKYNMNGLRIPLPDDTACNPKPTNGMVREFLILHDDVAL